MKIIPNGVESALVILSGKRSGSHAKHTANFIGSIKALNKSACPPETGRVSAIATHISNLAVHSGERLLIWDNDANKFTNSKEANRFIKPEYRASWKLPKV